MNGNFNIDEGTCIGVVRGYKLIKMGPYLFLIMVVLNTCFISSESPFAYDILFPNISSYQASIIDWVWLTLFICCFLLFIFSGIDGAEVYYYDDGLYHKRAIHFRNSSSERLPQIKIDLTTKSFYLKRKKYHINPHFKTHSRKILEFLEAKQKKEWSQEYQEFQRWKLFARFNFRDELNEKIEMLIDIVIDSYCMKRKLRMSDSRILQIHQDVKKVVYARNDVIYKKYESDDDYNKDLIELQESLRKELFDNIDMYVLKETFKLLQ